MCYRSNIMTKSPNIGVIANRERRVSLALLSKVAAEWQGLGMSIVGVLAEDNDAAGVCSAGFLRDIASGRKYSIHLDTPPTDTTCHIDAVGVEDACAGLIDQIDSADVVILSKFGKLEAMRQGLWPAFAATIAAGKPLLTTVSSKHAEALKIFAPEAIWLAADGPAVEHRWRTAKPAGFAAPAG